MLFKAPLKKNLYEVKTFLSPFNHPSEQSKTTPYPLCTTQAILIPVTHTGMA